MRCIFYGACRFICCLRRAEQQHRGQCRHGDPHSSTSRTQKSEPVQVKENPAKVDVVGEQAATAPTATAAPAQTPATGDFPVMYLAGVIGLILICSAGLLMLRKI